MTVVPGDAWVWTDSDELATAMIISVVVDAVNVTSLMCLNVSDSGIKLEYISPGGSIRSFVKCYDLYAEKL